MNNKLKKVFSYTTVFEAAEEGGFVVHVPALPGCHTQGDTFEEAMEMAKDAIGGYLEVLKEEGRKIPIEKEETVVTRINIPHGFI